ncbi:MAG: hypothetical protein GXP34_09005 [Actinobacteria bacterium]|nr:hypothetical protein [Actinomycetota bacterium]
MPGSSSRFWVLVFALAIVVAGCASVVTVGRKVFSKPKPVPVSVLVLDTAGSRIFRADITIAGESVVNGEEFGVLPNDFPVAVTVSAEGYRPASLSVPEPPEAPVQVRLAPVVLEGRITTESGDVLSDATVRLGDLGVTTGADGAFELQPAVPGTVTVERPAWMPAEVEWDGTEAPLEITLEPRVVRATHAVMWLPGRDLWEPFLDLASRTEINAVVLDIKDESGSIAHRSEVPLALDVGAVIGSYALDDAVGAIHERGLYAIGRVVSFEDPIVAKERTDLAIRRGSKPYRQGGQAFLDPTDPEARRYNIDIAVEACKAGIDEIQFDYVRFPTGMTAKMSLDGDGVYVGSKGQAARLAAIGGFLAEAREALHPLGCAVSADVFAIVLSTQNDQGIGQRPEEIGAEVDALSPMIYPDHYSDGWIGYDKPADHPFEVVDKALADGTPRIGPTTIMRPWIADFNYGAKSVRAEIDAVEGYGLGWMLWNAGSRHTEGALLPAEK